MIQSCEPKAYASASGRNPSEEDDVKAIVATKIGAPEVLKLQDVPRPEPKRGQVLVKVKFAGVNMVDTVERRGLFQETPRATPYIPGLEASGIVDAVGEGVTRFKAGDRVAYMQFLTDSYAEYTVVSEHLLFKLPDDVSFEAAAAMTVRGLTAHYLIHEYARITPGMFVVVHAAAGNMGMILTQWAKHYGAFVIGTTSSADKAKIAHANGCDAVIIYTIQDFPFEVMSITKGHGADLILDAVGKPTIPLDLKCANKRGTIVFYGMAGGRPDPIDPYFLYFYRSLRFCGGDCFNYLETAEEVQSRIDAVFDGYRKGFLRSDITDIVPLEQAPALHARLEGRATTGKFLLQVGS
jgi:NADPH2:quinone reductase